MIVSLAACTQVGSVWLLAAVVHPAQESSTRKQHNANATPATPVTCPAVPCLFYSAVHRIDNPRKRHRHSAAGGPDDAVAEFGNFQLMKVCSAPTFDASY
jgi:hypothetical protein